MHFSGILDTFLFRIHRDSGAFNSSATLVTSSKKTPFLGQKRHFFSSKSRLNFIGLDIIFSTSTSYSYLLRWGLFYLILINRHIFPDSTIRLIRNSITYSFVKQWLEVQFVKTLSVRQLQECHHLLFRPRSSTEQDQFTAFSLYIILGTTWGGGSLLCKCLKLSCFHNSKSISQSFQARAP